MLYFENDVADPQFAKHKQIVLLLRKHSIFSANANGEGNAFFHRAIYDKRGISGALRRSFEINSKQEALRRCSSLPYPTRPQPFANTRERSDGYNLG